MSHKGKFLVGLYVVGIAAVVVGAVLGGSLLLKDDSSQANSRTKILKSVPEDLTKQSSVPVNIQNYTFTPANIKVKKGATVTWTNKDPVPENAMLEHSGSAQVHNPPTVDQVRPDVFAGPTLSTGQTYSFTFTVAGAYIYHSASHPSMVGQVIVVD